MGTIADFEQRMIYEAGIATGDIDIELLRQRQGEALDNVHKWEYIHALTGLATALIENNDHHKSYWLSSLRSIGAGEWLTGRDPNPPAGVLPSTNP